MTSGFIKKQLKSKLGDLFCLYPFNLRLEITILDKFRGVPYDFKHTTFNIHYMSNTWADHILFFGEENTENGSSDPIVLHFNPKIS